MNDARIEAAAKELSESGLDEDCAYWAERALAAADVVEQSIATVPVELLAAAQERLDRAEIQLAEQRDEIRREQSIATQLRETLEMARLEIIELRMAAGMSEGPAGASVRYINDTLRAFDAVYGPAGITGKDAR